MFACGLLIKAWRKSGGKNYRPTIEFKGGYFYAIEVIKVEVIKGGR
jgi:hypothetical protein